MSSQPALFYIHQFDTDKTARELKAFLTTVPDDAIITLSPSLGNIRLDNYKDGEAGPKLIIEPV